METSAPLLQDTAQPVAYEQAYEPQPEVQEPVTTREELISRYGDRTLTYGKYEGTVAEIIKGDVCPHFKSMPDFALIKTVEVILVASDAKAKAEEMITKEQSLHESKQQPEKVAEKISTIVHETEKITAQLLQSTDEIIDGLVQQRSHPETKPAQVEIIEQSTAEPTDLLQVEISTDASSQQPERTEIQNYELLTEKPLSEALDLPVIALETDTEVHIESETTTSDNIVLDPITFSEAPMPETIAPVASIIELPSVMAESEVSNPGTFILERLFEDLEEIRTEPTERLIVMTDMVISAEEAAEHDAQIIDGLESLNGQQNTEAQELVLEIVELLEILQASEIVPTASELQIEQVTILIKNLADMLDLPSEPALLQRLADVLVQKVQIRELSYLELLKLRNDKGTSEHLLYGIGKSLQTSFSLHSLLGRYALTQSA